MELDTDRADLLACIALCELVGIVPGYLTRDDIADWYRTLERPDRTPPDWVFGPVWTVLYLLMGVSLHLTRRDVPYLLWVAFATTLNFDIWRLNR